MSRGSRIYVLADEPPVLGDVVRAAHGGARDIFVSPLQPTEVVREVEADLAPDIRTTNGKVRVGGFTSLTKREREVLELILQGDSNKEAGKMLLAPLLSAQGKRSAVWLNDRVFQSVIVGQEGASLHWVDGSSISVAWVHEMRAGQMSNEEFRSAMTILDASLQRMAGLLGKSRRLIASYRKDQPIPR